MKIILHADDFGFDQDTCEATIDLFERGVLKSATIMTNMPGTKIALSYAKQHPEFSFGVHLNYVDNLTPNSESKEILSLVDYNGKFYPSNDVRKKALLFQFQQKDIIKESLNQIKILQQEGIPISHIDSHGHLHKFPAFLFSLRNICKIAQINKVRRVQNIHLHPQGISINSILNKYFDSYIKKNFITTDYFYMPANNNDTQWGNSIEKIISKYSFNKILEIGVHPGFVEKWRKNEYYDILDFVNLVGSSQELINWNQV